MFDVRRFCQLKEIPGRPTPAKNVLLSTFSIVRSTGEAILIKVSRNGCFEWQLIPSIVRYLSQGLVCIFDGLLKRNLKSIIILIL